MANTQNKKISRARRIMAAASGVAQQTAAAKDHLVDLQFVVHSGSRKPFAEEAPVVEAAQQAAQVVAEKYGKPPGAAMFRDTGKVSAATPVHPQAVDLARAAISRLTGVPYKPKMSAAQAAVEELNSQAAAKAMLNVARMRRRLEQSQAGPAVLESLRRLGINV
ncbi:hypothetical protein [Janthinobacterium sp. Ant5-2-1]|uniref:hypothetical protein n=1 Tax=Janthinobacterium sp. Ant5-2-1 TaxID=1755239 RepID=UPI0007182F80|nr:hypothetical protein [Janthinobacterium sp. Ant5-2-1]